MAQDSRPPESVFDEVDECDLLAAHPADPQRLAEGVDDDAIVPRLAIRACRNALQQEGKELRFAFQLGRALIAGGRRDDARGHLERAAESNYPAAIATLADLQLELRDIAAPFASVSGTDAAAMAKFTELTRAAQQAIKEAVAKHERAAAAGFEASRGRIDALTFAPTIYTQPILGQIAGADFTAVVASSRQPETRAYLYAFTTNVLNLCGPIFDAMTVVGLAIYRFGGQVTEDQEASTLVAVQPLVGEVDAQRFVRRHGCDGPVADLFGYQLKASFGFAQTAAR